MKKQLPVFLKVQVAFGAVMTVLLVVGIVAYRSVLASSESAQRAQHTDEVLEHLANLRLGMENVESGYREFALSGADSFLQWSRTNASLVDKEQSALRALTADNPHQQRRLSIVTDVLQRMVQRGDSIVRMRGTPAAEDTAALIRSGQDDPLLNAYRGAVRDMEAEEQQLLRERKAAAVSRFREAQVALILGSTLALLIAAVCGWQVARDRTERKGAEDRLKRLNRLYAMVTGITTSTVRVRDRADLFNRSCRTAVEHGEFEMAWIAIVDPTENRIVPVAWAGRDEPAMSVIKAHFASSEGTLEGNTLAARAIREKAAVVSNDVQTDERLVFGKMHAESGIRSLAVIPLIVSDNAIGVFTLYTSKPEFFDAAGLLLLTELAGNVAFAIDHLERQERLDRLYYYDTLTGLANRRSFLERVTQYMLSAADDGHKMAVFLIDLERFKKLNDSLGRSAGDALLKQVAEWLAQNAKNVNFVARLDADHFAVALPKVTYEANVARVLEETIAAFMKHEFSLDDAVYRMAAKIGVAVFPDDGTDADTLFNNAEAALKKAKASRDRYLFYAQKMTETVAMSLGIENRLRRALEREEFVLHYQPKVNIVSGKLTGAEALIRWNDPVSGLTPPGRFIPILEETGLIHEVGRWVLRQAIADYQRWRNDGLPAVRIAVNVSPLQLRNRNFAAEIQQAISVAADAAAGLQLEITESVIMQDVNHSIGSLLAIRELGVTIAIDDFGTGFSSLNYLAKLPVDTLKIDRSFVVEMVSATGGLTLVSVIINLAHALKLNTVAEGVETEEQLRQLRLLGCDEMQGYLFGKPVPVESFEQKYMRASSSLIS
ncbi:MAG TPA: EAL domain-containing protein [Steroidobacteraceae bacterium]|nr:EAL domain-containing protein [Steroidobacteraceae bacterium]